MTIDEIIEQIAARLGAAVPPRSKVVLFGSQARGDARDGSDFDVLVIEPAVTDVAVESVRWTHNCAGLAFRSMSSSSMRRPRAGVRLSAAPWSSGRCAKARCLSSPEHREVAELMLAKARADASAARLLATHEDQDDGIIGFHAQQACEKALKAVLAIVAADIPLSHNLGFLHELVGVAVEDVPDAVGGSAA